MIFSRTSTDSQTNKELTTKKLKLAEMVRESKHLQPCAKLIFEHLLLKYHNNKTGQCNPSEKTLANDLKMSGRQIQRFIRELKECGCLSVQRQRRGNQYNPKSNQYYFNWDIMRDDKIGNETRQNRPMRHDKDGGLTIDEPCKEHTPEGVCSVSPQATNHDIDDKGTNNSDTKKVTSLQKKESVPRSAYIKDCERFWQHYPRQVGDAQTVFNAFVRAVENNNGDAAAIVEGAWLHANWCNFHYRKQDQQRYIKKPINWLKENGWTDTAQQLDPYAGCSNAAELRTDAMNHAATVTEEEQQQQEQEQPRPYGSDLLDYF